MTIDLTVRIERFPIAGSFTIARGSKTEAAVVTCSLTDGTFSGIGECVPYGRYGETVEGVAEAIAAMADAIRNGLDRDALQSAMPAGAARNAIDCAFWDLEAKRRALPVHGLAGLSIPGPLVTAYTISLGEPDVMAAQTAQHAGRALLKVKVGTADDRSRIRAVRSAAPDSAIILDANEGWTPETLAFHFEACREASIALIEQPLPAGRDQALAEMPRPVPVCADESVHGAGDVAALADRYDAINIKLDKAGGLTEAIRLRDAARQCGMTIMVGCMVGTSLGMAPAVLLAQGAAFVDLDGPLLLARDRPNGLVYEGSLVFPPEPALWG